MIDELADLAAELYLAEQDAAVAAATRVEVVGTVADRMRAELVPLFLAPWDARAPVTDMVTGRRVGKTEYDDRLLLRGAWENPLSTNPYILPTAAQARLVSWPILKRVTLRHFPDAVVNETLMTVKPPGCGTVVCGGCEHAADVGKWFGMPFEEAVIDECGNFGGHLKALHTDAIKPGTLDFRGRITRTGNPGLICEGPWWDWTKPGLPKVIRGNATCNPYVKDVEQFFDEVCEEESWTREAPTFVRLYLGEWVTDLGALVYPYEHTRNGLARGEGDHGLPLRNAKGRLLDPRGWRYVISLDPAGLGVTGVSVLAAHGDRLGAIVLESSSHASLESGALAEMTRDLKAKYQTGAVVMDTGGLGSGHALTFASRYGIGVIPAEKSERHAAIRWCHDMMVSGTLVVLEGEQNDPVRSEWLKLGWDSKQLDTAPGKPNHISDTVMYGLRYLYPFANDAAPTPFHAPSSAEQFAIDEAAEEEREERQTRRSAKGRGLW